MRKVCLGMVVGLALVSCRQDAPTPVVEETASVPEAAAEAPETPAPPVTTAGTGARAVAEETDDFLFEYSYPAEVGNIAELASLLDARMDRARNEIAGYGADGRKDARASGFPYNRYSSGTFWAVVTEIPGFLSLSANLNSYSGGAHGNSGHDALIWDKEVGAVIDAASLFVSLDALDSAIGIDLCRALTTERGIRRGIEIGAGTDAMFEECVALEDVTILLGSSTGDAFDRIGFLMAPYVAGPYVEGTYEFTLPVNDRVLDIVRQEYRTAFAAAN